MSLGLGNLQIPEVATDELDVDDLDEDGIQEALTIAQAMLDAELATIQEQFTRIDQNDRILSDLQSSLSSLQQKGDATLAEIGKEIDELESKRSQCIERQQELDATVGARERAYSAKRVESILQRAKLATAFGLCSGRNENFTLVDDVESRCAAGQQPQIVDRPVVAIPEAVAIRQHHPTTRRHRPERQQAALRALGAVAQRKLLRFQASS